MTGNKNLSPGQTPARKLTDEERHRKLVLEGIPQGLQAERYNPDWTLKTIEYPRVLGLGGRLRSGKDEVADHLVRAHGWAKIGMSDAVHEFLLAQNPDIRVESAEEPFVASYVTVMERYGYREGKKFREVRSLLQRTGTDAARGVLYEDVWVDAARTRMLAHLAQGRSVVLTGLRFENEVRMIRDLKGVAAWVDRPVESQGVNVDTLVSALDTVLSHSSENSVHEEQFDITIPNHGTLADLYAWVDAYATAEEHVDRPWPHYDH